MLNVVIDDVSLTKLVSWINVIINYIYHGLLVNWNTTQKSKYLPEDPTILCIQSSLKYYSLNDDFWWIDKLR